MNEFECPNCISSNIQAIVRNSLVSYKCDDCFMHGSEGVFKKNISNNLSFYSNGLTVIPFKNVLAVEGDIMSYLDDKPNMNTICIWVEGLKEHLFLSGEECDDFLNKYQIYLKS